MSRVILIAYDGAATLDLTGPADVFTSAPDSAYDVVFASRGGGRRRCSSGLCIDTRDLLRVRPVATDTVIVAGGGEAAIRRAVEDAALLQWLQRAAGVVERMASVCSGAFLLASAGLLEGKRAATHWRACAELGALFPSVKVDPNAIYVRDGSTWTSAGVTTGIDMSLAMVEDDLGRGTADGLAAELVLYARRPGYQAQFSSALVTQTSSSDNLRAALAWLREHLEHGSVALFAKRAGLSVRTLHRRCEDELATPAKLIARLRVEQARTLLSTTQLSAKTVATRCGFGNPVRMSRAFQRELGMGPRDYRLLHSA